MVKCEFCLNFDGIRCIEARGVKYNKKIDPLEEISCPYYFEKGFLFALLPPFDDYFFNIFR
ncbi:MAG: hypothetical protein H5T44_00920 [Thermoplasmatales archaeon]|nr:hypothetical protein [Thermoplasmatales archaeon]